MLWFHHRIGIIGVSKNSSSNSSTSSSSSSSNSNATTTPHGTVKGGSSSSSSNNSRSSTATGGTFKNNADMDSFIYPWDLSRNHGQQQQSPDVILKSLPVWIQDYMAWHQTMRRRFPGTLLLEHFDAPPLLIRTCLGLCGGLHDRLGQLPWDLYLANQTRRVLLLHWHRPVPVEHFFQPQPSAVFGKDPLGAENKNTEFILDWRVPPGVAGFFPGPAERAVSRQGMRHVRNAYPDLFEGYASEHPEDDFWNAHLDLALQRATVGAFQKHRVLRHRLLGHLNEDVLERRLAALGETDLLHSTPSFGRIFHLFFRPSPAVQDQVVAVIKDLMPSSTSSLSFSSFSAVHCRVRHPKATAGLVKGKNENYPADKSGLPWHGETRAFAIATAIHALRCARSLHSSTRQKDDAIYFFSDSNDLVRFMTRELLDPEYVSANQGALSPSNQSSMDAQALQLVQSIPARLVARDPETENAHIDRQKGRDASAYYGSFVDLYVAMAARCVTYGIGWYAVFAAKVSATDCTMLYQEEAWGGTDTKQLHSTRQCTLPPPALLHTATD